MVNLPDEVYDQAVRIAGQQHAAVEDFIVAALADHLATRE